MPEKRNLVCREGFSRLRWFPVDDLPNNTVSLVRLQVSALIKVPAVELDEP